MKSIKDFRSKQQSFDSEDSMRRASKLEPIKAVKKNTLFTVGWTTMTKMTMQSCFPCANASRHMIITMTERSRMRSSMTIWMMRTTRSGMKKMRRQMKRSLMMPNVKPCI
jgi:hypothetical protein